MRFEVSERITTRADKVELLTLLEDQFRKIASSVQRHGESLEATSIEASFGSINRRDRTLVELKPTNDGFVAIASVHYRPSVAFWIILIITFFTYVFWIVPIVFYLLQRQTVRNAIQEVFTRAKHEFQDLTGSAAVKRLTDLDLLEKLATLRDKGTITEEEFLNKKKVLLA